MKHVPAAVVVIAIASTSASAGPFKETLSANEIKAIASAIQAALPKVDVAAAERCTGYLDAYNKDPGNNLDKLAPAAACFRAAGSLAAAINMWMLIEKYEHDSTKRHDAFLGLGAAFEAAGRFDQAATYEQKFAKEFAKDPLAPGQLTRAICIRRQLGDNQAIADLHFLRSLDPKRAIDEATLCDQLRPIAMPATTTR